MSGYQSNSVLASTVALPAAGDFPVPGTDVPRRTHPQLARLLHPSGGRGCLRQNRLHRPPLHL